MFLIIDSFVCFQMKPTCGGTRTTPGNKVGYFDTKFGRVGGTVKDDQKKIKLFNMNNIVAICFDIEHVDVTDALFAKNPFLILNPTHIPAPASIDQQQRLSAWHNGN
jgi:predicted amidohydrolase